MGPDSQIDEPGALDAAAGLAAEHIVENQVAARALCGEVARLLDGKIARRQTGQRRRLTTDFDVTTAFRVPRLRAALDDVIRGCRDVI